MTLPILPPGGSLVRASPVPAAASAVPSPAALKPPGLWAVLSRAERMFFEVPEGTGVLGYGPAGAPTEVAPVIGQQLDVRA